MRSPEKVEARLVFLPVHCSRPTYNGVKKRHIEVSIGKLCSCIYTVRKFLIDSPTIIPCTCGIKIIKELIESGYLGRLDGLIRHQRSLQSPECGNTQRGVWPGIPDEPKFRVELIFILYGGSFSLEEVATATDSERDIFQELNIGIHIQIRVLGISIYPGIEQSYRGQ